jgi:hypothetical protein
MFSLISCLQFSQQSILSASNQQTSVFHIALNMCFPHTDSLPVILLSSGRECNKFLAIFYPPFIEYDQTIAALLYPKFNMTDEVTSNRSKQHFYLSLLHLAT